MGARNFLVEGVSGTGKTSVCLALRRRGLRAAGTRVDATALVGQVVDEIRGLAQAIERDEVPGRHL